VRAILEADGKLKKALFLIKGTSGQKVRVRVVVNNFSF
jgi:hypothetical protein